MLQQLLAEDGDTEAIRRIDPTTIMSGMDSQGHQQLHVHIRLEDGALWATVDEFPGVFATGDNLAELRESLEEGIALVLAEPGGEVPEIHLAPLRPEPVETAASPDLVLA